MFYKILLNNGLNPYEYIKEVKKNAKKKGYDDKLIFFSDKPKYKIYILTPENKKIYFGSSINNDFIIYKMLEKKGLVEKGTANKKRFSYLARAKNIKGEWKKNFFSKNNLAINILW